MDNNVNHKNLKCNRNPEKQIARRRDNYELFDPFFDDLFRFPEISHEFKRMENIMRTDVKEHENGYSIEIEMPGFDKDDINLDLSNGYLTIEAQRNVSDDENDKNGNFVRRERYFGSCSRSFYVGDIDEKDIDAKLERGILLVFVPKDKQLETKKRIEIK